jgi:predicted cobalt transporter CbtA
MDALPPRPPGIIQADLAARQFWWAATVVLSAIGMWLIAGQRISRWFHKLAGLAVIALPHLAGAPSITRKSIVPPQLMTRFTAASLFAAAMFWTTLGFSGGFFLNTLANMRTRGTTADQNPN